jgi:hypothetical protein
MTNHVEREASRFITSSVNRMRELADGFHDTVVNGKVLLEKRTHTGSYPGRVLHNARYHGTHNGRGSPPTASRERSTLLP